MTRLAVIVRIFPAILAAAVCLNGGGSEAARAPVQKTERVAWKDALRQRPEWYGSAEAVRIAGNLLLYQHDCGGWDKNIDMSNPLQAADLARLEDERRKGQTTIDNGATWTQMRYLARVYTATHEPRFASAFRRGLEYLFAAQYANGGWPQFYPLRDGYWSHITYNDDAMISVMETLRDIAGRKPDYAFLSDAERLRARQAVDKGLQCILKTQVVVDGRRTVWCAQHDERTLAPAKARSYELPSLSGSESVPIVHYLMQIDHPSAEVVGAVQAAIAWFSEVKITGIRVSEEPAPGSAQGKDRVVVEDKQAPPLWARFYEIGTNRPFFCGRDGVVKYRLSEIEYERRNGYRWYVDRPAKLLDEEYPEWRRRWGITPDARTPHRVLP